MTTLNVVSENHCQHKQRHWLLNLLDTSGAVASGVCAVHCVATPLFLALAPALGGLFSHEAIHIAMFALVLPIAILTLGFSAWRTKRWILLLIGLFGCSLLALGLELEHHYAFGWWSPATWSNIAGGLVLANAHLYNLRIRSKHENC